MGLPCGHLVGKGEGVWVPPSPRHDPGNIPIFKPTSLPGDHSPPLNCRALFEGGGTPAPSGALLLAPVFLACSRWERGVTVGPGDGLRGPRVVRPHTAQPHRVFVRGLHMTKQGFFWPLKSPLISEILKPMESKEAGIWRSHFRAPGCALGTGKRRRGEGPGPDGARRLGPGGCAP